VTDNSNRRRLRVGGLPQVLLQWGLGGLAALVLFLMMLLTFVDVIGRYLLNAPVTGSFEIIELMVAALVFCALPLVTAREEHVAVDLFSHLLSARTEQIRAVVVGLLNAIILIAIAVKVWQKAAESARYGDQTAMLYWPTAPVFYFISLCLGCSAVIAMSLAWRYFKGQSIDSTTR
jgi:TRAP-type C4-dicarboxylate transport system permease small subunit